MEETRRYYELVASKYSSILGCKTESLEEVLESLEESWCSRVLAALLLGHPALIGLSSCFDCSLVSGYNTLWLAARDSSTPLRARRILESLAARLRSYIYDRTADYASLGLNIGVVESKRGYPLYLTFICRSQDSCGFQREDHDTYFTIHTWSKSFTLVQLIPKTISREYLSRILG